MTHDTDIYLADIGPEALYGYCTTDEPLAENEWDAWAYCVLDNDYAANEFTTGTPMQNMRVTAAHEYFHAVQFGYDAFEDGWFMEATATWAEDELFDDIDDNLQYLSAGPLGQPWVPLDWFGGSHHYGDWIWFRYLSERFPSRGRRHADDRAEHLAPRRRDSRGGRRPLAAGGEPGAREP